MPDANSENKLLAHMVYFTLKDKSPAAINRMITACKEHLSDHPGTIFFAAGTLNPELQREVNVRDFDIALHVIFASKADHDRYQVSARHQKFIDENRDNWAQVRVFDSDVAS